MAGYECTFCDTGRPVVVLVTSLTTGQTLASCQDDMPIMLIGQLSSELGTDAQRTYDAVQRFADREAKSAAKAAAAAAEQGTGAADDQDPPDRSDDISGDAVDDQGGMSELAQLGQEGEQQ